MKHLILLLIPFLSFSQLDTAMYNGEGRINILYLGDGYQEGESNLFISDVFSSTEYMFNQAPFKEYRDYFNVFYSVCHSNESGADHPGHYSDPQNAGYESSCENTPLFSFLADTFYVETYNQELNLFEETMMFDTVFVPVDNCFGSSFDLGVHRCLAPDGDLLFTYVDSVANGINVETITIINSQDESHGGCAGGAGAASSRGSNGTILHEFGHSFGGLADEYWEVLRSCYGGEAINRTSEYYTNLTPNTITTTKWINWMDGTSDIGFKQHLGGTDSNDDEIFTNNPNPSIQDICDEDNDEDSEEPFLDSDIDFDGILNIYSENGDGDSNMDNDGFNNYPDDGTIYNVNNFLFYYIDDLDNDGIPTYDENGNILDDDIDGDGCKNENDYDVDGDGVYEDIDEDGIYNKDDNDIDGDGINNNDDTNPYGILDCLSNCNDDDTSPYGTLDCLANCNDDDDDIDGDGLINSIDDDDDGDGVPDFDCDGNILDNDFNNDNDDDNDGVIDDLDLNLNLDNDLDNDGILNMDYSVLGTYENPNVEVCEDYLWYRPSPNGCLMGSGGDNGGFCSICIEEIIERIHDKTNPINEFNYSYQNSNGEIIVNNETVFNLSNEETASFPYNFNVNLILPVPNTLDIEWTINGNPLNTVLNLENTTSSVQINLQDLNYGQNTITICVEDTTNYLRIDSHQEENHPHSNIAPSFSDHTHSSHLFCQDWQINNTITIGCMDSNACNYYPDATVNSGCQYLVDECGICGGDGLSFFPPESYYDCNGNCNNDLDGDLICDELEIFGCTDLTACNYNSMATESNNTCEYPAGFPFNIYNCEGECILDLDNDTYCDSLDNCPTNYNPNQENSNNLGLGDACLCNLLTLVPINPSFNGFTINQTESFYISTNNGDYANDLTPSFNINEPYNSDDSSWDKNYIFINDGPDILELTFFNEGYVVLDIHFLSGLFELPCIVSQEFDIWSLSIDSELYFVEKKFIKAFDVLGREVKKEQKNQMIFHLYNDGSIEKKYIK